MLAVVRRAGSLAVAAVLVVSVMSMSAAVADDPTLSDPTAVVVADSDDDGVLDAPDKAAAVAGAVAEGEPVEDLSARTATSTTVANEDGSFTRKQFGPVQRVKRDGGWVDVDYTLEKRPDGSYAPRVAPTDTVIGAGGSNSAATVSFDDAQSLEVTWPQQLPAPTIEGATATYAVSATSDLVVTATGAGVSTHLLLKSRPAAGDPSFTFGLTTTDTQLSETTSGGLVLKDEDEKRVGGVASLVAWDSRRDAAGDTAVTVPLSADLTETSSSAGSTDHELEVTPPAGFLQDPATQYPVVVDPDVQGLTQARDVWVREGDTANTANDDRLVVGKRAASTNTNPARAYIQFAMAGIASAEVVSADIDLYQYYAASCTPKTLVARPVDEGWLAEGTVFSNAPAIRSTSTYNSVMTANRGAGCTPAAGITTVDVTDMTRQWLRRIENSSTGFPNFGTRLDVGVDNEGQSSYERRFCSFASGKPDEVDTTANCDTTARQPSMTITYNEPPAVPTKPTVTFGGNPVTVYTKVKDANREEKLRAKLVVKRDSTTIFAGDTNMVQVSKGAAATEVKKTLPYLPDGKYTVTAQAVDDLGKTSALSAATTFTVETEFGSQSWYSSTQHGLNDRSGVAVNNRTGNLTVQAGDVKVNGLGLDLDATRFYNAQSTQTTTQGVVPASDLWATSMGKGWGLSVGPDVWLEKKSATEFDYHAPGGTVFGPFTRESSTSDNYTKPPGGVGADLKKDGTTYRLTFRNSQFAYEFQEFGTSGDLYQTLSKDRSGNSITFAYSGTTPNGRAKLTTITDASARTYPVTYTGDYITKVAEAGTGGREWSYGYGTGALADYPTSYTDPDGKTTNYAYASSTTSTMLLNSIQDPPGANGLRTTTTVDYGTETTDPANLDRVRALHYAKASGTVDFTWAYGRRTADATCASKSDYSTNVTDGRSKVTSYCFNDSKSVDTGGDVRVYDAEGNVKGSSFTADKATAEVTSPTNAGVTGGSTVASYGGGGITDQLDSVTEPKSEEDAGKTAGTTSFDYDPDESAPGGDYLPSNVTDPNGDCSNYDYDDKGRTTAAYTGLAATSCSPDTGDTGFHRSYNDNGTVSASWDANATSNPGSEEKTLYTYWAGGDSGYVPGTAGQLKTIRKPGGSCGTPRKLCTSYTYDGAARVLTVTDGRGTVTTYTYDKIDRTTAAYFNGSGPCLLANTNCVLYGYDAEGNTSARTDSSGSSSFEYDRLNRQTKQSLPGGTVIDLAYDDNGNLITHTQTLSGPQGPDTVGYAYDDANRLKTVTDATGTTNITPDGDGRVKQVKYPGVGTGPGVEANYTFKRSGKPKTATVKLGSQTLRDYTYSYIQTVDLPAPFGSVEMESSQLQTRTVASAPTGNGVTTYGYGQSRLESASNSNGALPDYEYKHDKVGNVTKEKIDATSTFHGYDRAGELCWSGPNEGSSDDALRTACQPGPSGSTDLSSDAAGNNTGTTGAARTYNDISQVTSIGGIAMSYSDLGNDLRTQAGTTTFVNSPLGVTARKTGTDIVYYTRDSNGNILNAHGAGGTKNYVSEFNGSVAALYNPAGTLVAAYEYSPYGKTTASGTDAATNPFRYVGGYQDKDSTGADGSYKLGARYYDGRGHFTQPDAIAGTISDPKTLTSYNYAGGDPVNSSDPSGRSLEAASEAADFIGGCFGAGTLAYGATEFAAAGGLAAVGIGGTVAATGGAALLAGTAVCTGSILLKGIAPDIGDTVNEIVGSFPGF